MSQDKSRIASACNGRRLGAADARGRRKRLIRALGMILLLALAFASAPAASAQPASPTPGADGTREAPVQKQPTEYFAYGAVGLLFLLLFALGVMYIRTVMKSAES